MARLNLFSIFDSSRSSNHANNDLLPSSNAIRQNLVNTNLDGTTTHNPLVKLLQRFMSGPKIDGGSRTVAEEKVY
ncbi:hypothetical protein Q3G72_026307 [Acer saccharum]|nr:hypothetical protein Q3G72_026307 [Acer saccharum]